MAQNMHPGFWNLLVTWLFSNTGKVKIGPMLKDSRSLVLHAWRAPDGANWPKAKGERYKAGSILF
jgi:hypothetical protein